MQSTSMKPSQPLRMGVRQAASVLGITEPALRQLLKRRTELLPVTQVEDRMTLDVNDVLTYFSRKRRLPHLTDQAMRAGTFINLFAAGAKLLMSTQRVLDLLRKGEITGGVTTDNQILILASSVNRYATGEATTNESADL
jgi:hypothetical protein